MASNKSYSYINEKNSMGDMKNTMKNIIAGPKQGEYWNHSTGLEVADVLSESAFPIQGNIGSLIKQEGINNYASCSMTDKIGGGPNCVGVFNKDIYTSTDECGNNCRMSGPESYGMQSFGMVNKEITNIHGLHAYKNIRAGAEGQGTSNTYGCYENIPSLKNVGGKCETDYSKFEVNTVGDFTKLNNWQKFNNGY
jgi:hypothetical protein